MFCKKKKDDEHVVGQATVMQIVHGRRRLAEGEQLPTPTKRYRGSPKHITRSPCTHHKYNRDVMVLCVTIR